LRLKVAREEMRGRPWGAPLLGFPAMMLSFVR
jgi:hypothetical protein